MPDLFGSNAPGRVYVYRTGSGLAVPGYLKLDPTLVAGDGFNSPIIITGFGFTQGTNTRFIPTLRDIIYVYSFGDKMGQFTLDGLLFDKMCQSALSDTPFQGINAMLTYYKANKASVSNTPVVISLGEFTIKGFITDLTLKLANPELRTTAFTMPIAALPIISSGRRA